ncbi:MAG: glycosyltransferase [Candidatus Aminicenantaceae bacterium]
MRMLYSFGYFLDDPGGHVIHSVKFCEAFEKAGHEIKLIGPVRKFTADQREHILPEWVIPVKGWNNAFHLALKLRKALANQALQWKPDFLYVRPALKDTLAIHWAAGAGIPLFVEINVLTFHEHFRSGRFLKAFLSHIIEKWELKHSQGIICITEEIARMIKSRIKNTKPICVTGNGFDPEEIPLASFNTSARDELDTPESAKVILFAGTLEPAEGLDLLLPVLKDIKDLYLWIIGEGKEKSKLKDLANKLGITPRMRWLQWIRSEDLFAYLEAADFGIASLAAVRKNMNEAQSMKVRTFLGAGLPVLIGYDDTRLRKDLPWIKKVNAIAPGEINGAIKELLSQPVRDITYRKQIREFAKKVLSWDTIANETIPFIKSVLRTDCSG